MDNCGNISFEKNSSGNHVRGRGFFVDIGTNLAKSHFNLDRISGNEIKALIGKPLITNYDKGELIKRYAVNSQIENMKKLFVLSN